MATSTDSLNEADKEIGEAANHLIQGKRHLLVQDYESAVGSLQQACELFAQKYGESANECGEPYLYYGKALLELARMEPGVLGNALEGVPKEEESDSDEDDSQIESPENVTEEEREKIKQDVNAAIDENSRDLEDNFQHLKDQNANPTEKSGDPLAEGDKNETLLAIGDSSADVEKPKESVEKGGMSDDDTGKELTTEKSMDSEKDKKNDAEKMEEDIKESVGKSDEPIDENKGNLSTKSENKITTEKNKDSERDEKNDAKKMEEDVKESVGKSAEAIDETKENLSTKSEKELTPEKKIGSEKDEKNDTKEMEEDVKESVGISAEAIDETKGDLSTISEKVTLEINVKCEKEDTSEKMEVDVKEAMGKSDEAMKKIEGSDSLNSETNMDSETDKMDAVEKDTKEFEEKSVDVIENAKGIISLETEKGITSEKSADYKKEKMEDDVRGLVGNSDDSIEKTKGHAPVNIENEVHVVITSETCVISWGKMGEFEKMEENGQESVGKADNAIEETTESSSTKTENEATSDKNVGSEKGETDAIEENMEEDVQVTVGKPDAVTDGMKETVQQMEHVETEAKDSCETREKTEASSSTNEVNDDEDVSMEEVNDAEEAGDESEETVDKKEEEAGPSGLEKEEEISNLQLAWEVLEIAKIIFQRQSEIDKKMELKTAEVLLKLGEIGIESENYKQAIDDFSECLRLQKLHLTPDDRAIAETFYQLGLAYSFHAQYNESIENFNRSMRVIEERISVLQQSIEGGAESRSSAKDTFEGLEDPVEMARREINDLKSVLPDIKSKIEDTEDMMKNSTAALKEAALQRIQGVSLLSESSEASFTEPSINRERSTSKPVTNITHLIKRKQRKSDGNVDEVSDAKKMRGESGDCVFGVVANGEASSLVMEAEGLKNVETTA